MILHDMFDSTGILNMLNVRWVGHLYLSTQLSEYPFLKKNTILMLNKENKWRIQNYILLVSQLHERIIYPNDYTPLICILDQMSDF